MYAILHARVGLNLCRQAYVCKCLCMCVCMCMCMCMCMCLMCLMCLCVCVYVCPLLQAAALSLVYMLTFWFRKPSHSIATVYNLTNLRCVLYGAVGCSLSGSLCSLPSSLPPHRTLNDLHIICNVSIFTLSVTSVVMCSVDTCAADFAARMCLSSLSLPNK